MRAEARAKRDAFLDKLKSRPAVMHVGVGIDPHPGRDRRNERVWPDGEGRRNRGGVFVDDDREGFDAPRIAGRQGRAHRHGYDRGVLRPTGHLDREQVRSVRKRPAVEHLIRKARPRILLGSGAADPAP